MARTPTLALAVALVSLFGRTRERGTGTREG